MQGFGQGLGTGLIAACVLLILLVWGSYKVVDRFFVDHSIRVEKPILPDIELVVKDNKVDTVYVYRFR